MKNLIIYFIVCTVIFGQKVVRIGFFPNITHGQALYGKNLGIFEKNIKNTKKEIGKRNLPLKQRNEILCRYQKIGQDKYKTLSDELNTIVFNELMPLALEKKLITEDDPVLWNDLYWMPLFFESELDIKKEESEKKWIFSLEIDLNLLQGAFKSYVLENKLDILSVKGRGPSLKNKVGLAAALLPYRDILNGRFYED
jgi:hypothetical protein